MGKTPGMQPRPKREHSGTSPSSANRKRPPGPWPESVVSSVPCSQTYTNILPLLCVSLAPSIARKPGFVNRRVTARDRKIPLGSARRNFVSSPRPLHKNPFRPGPAGPPSRLPPPLGAMVASGDRPSPVSASAPVGPGRAPLGRRTRAGRRDGGPAKPGRKGFEPGMMRAARSAVSRKRNGSIANSQGALAE